jgi:hypothetical protein
MNYNYMPRDIPGAQTSSPSRRKPKITRSLVFGKRLLALSLLFVLGGPQIFQISKSHLQILRVRWVRWGKFRAKEPQVRSDLWTLLLADDLCSVRTNWNIFVWRAIYMLKMLDATTPSITHKQMH